MIRRLLLLTVVLAALAFGATQLLDRARMAEGDLSQPPERLALAPSIPEAPSSLQLRLVLPTAALTAALDREMPTDHRISGTQRVCIDVQTAVRDRVGAELGGELGQLLGNLAGELAREAAGTRSGQLCQDVTYDIAIRRNGAPRVRGTGDALEITLPIAVDGRAGIPGDLARSLGFDSRAFRGAIDVIARVTADLEPNWCPRLSAEGDFRWTDRARLEIVDGTWIDIDQPAGLELRRRIAQGIAALDGLVTCGTVRDAIAPEWREIALPLPGAETLGHLLVRPTGAGFSGIDYGAEAISAALQVDAVTELRTGPPPEPRLLDLPQLARIGTAANRVDVNLPIRLGYDQLTAELNRQLAGRTFTGRTPAGEARVTVEEVTLYPSGDRLAAGLRFTASHDSRMLGASGWAYLAARPVISDDGRTLRLADVALTRQVDNDLWALLSNVFNDQIAARIAEEAVFPLDPAIATARTQLTAALADLEARTGVRVTLSDPDIALTTVVPAAEALEAVARFRTRAEVTVRSLR